jgi:hypothetical protein
VGFIYGAEGEEAINLKSPKEIAILLHTQTQTDAMVFASEPKVTFVLCIAMTSPAGGTHHEHENEVGQALKIHLMCTVSTKANELFTGFSSFSLAER